MTKTFIDREGILTTRYYLKKEELKGKKSLTFLRDLGEIPQGTEFIITEKKENIFKGIIAFEDEVKWEFEVRRKWDSMMVRIEI